MLQWYGLCCCPSMLCYVVSGPEALCDPLTHYFAFTDLSMSVSVCFVMSVAVTGRISGRKGVCVLSGFLFSSLADQKKSRVWRVCSRWVFVVAVVLPTLLACTTSLLVVVFVCDGNFKRKKTCAVPVENPALAFLWPRAREPLSDCSLCPCDFGFRCSPASANSKKRLQSEQRKARWSSHMRTHSATASQPAIWSEDQPSVAWEIHT